MKNKINEAYKNYAPIKNKKYRRLFELERKLSDIIVRANEYGFKDGYKAAINDMKKIKDAK